MLHAKFQYHRTSVSGEEFSTALLINAEVTNINSFMKQWFLSLYLFMFQKLFFIIFLFVQ